MEVQEQTASAHKPATPELSEEDRSKDKFFNDIAALSNAMIAAHGRDFAMGALILAARFIAENKPLTKPAAPAACGCGSDHKGHDHGHHHHKT
ncbi:MAG: hypothetical protein ABL907_13560 [Hyphomicrobium sp.]